VENEILILIPIFFLIASIYASAGFGGGSSYLAVLALFPIPFTTIRMTALLCNIAVVAGSVYLFHRKKYLKLKRIAPLILLSIPMAYWGGRFKLDERVFFLILSAVLILASVLMIVQSAHSEKKKLPLYSNGLIGGGIGFLSGMVGIGGGIFLSPVLYFSKWAEAKVIAATTALFILVNSIAGLVGQIVTHGLQVEWRPTLFLLLSVFIGGQIGSRLSINKFNPVLLKKITGLLILIIGVRIFVQHF